MNKKLKEELISFLRTNELAKNFVTSKTVTKTYSLDPKNNDDIAVTSSGTHYSKSAVVNYLKENNYPLTQQNFDLVAEQFSIKNSKEYIQEIVESESTDFLDEISEDELTDYVNFSILKQLTKIQKDINNYPKIKYEYCVRSLKDVSGGTDTFTLENMLNTLSSDGWHFKFAFVNELGKDSLSIGGVGVNSTVDQVLLIFERQVN